MDFIEREQKFWDDYTDKLHDIDLEIVNKRISKEQPWYEKYIGKLTGKSILDVGCGTDDVFIPYWIKDGNKVTATDMSSKSIEYNKEMLNKLKLKANFVVSAIEDLKFKNKFDIVHVKWILHHTLNIPRSLIPIYDSLKKDGIAIITESNILHPARFIVQFPYFRKINFLRYLAINKGPLDPDEQARTPWYYINAIRKAGFKIKKIDYHSGYEMISYLTRIYIKSKKINKFFKAIDRLLLKLPFAKYLSMDVKIIAVK